MRKLFSFLAVLLCCSAAPGQSADIILTNGKVFTSNKSQLYTQAVAIKGNKIVATGTTAEIEKLADKNTNRINLQGKTVVPGFNDAHYHHSPYYTGYAISYPMDGREPAWQELKDSIVAAVRNNAAGTFINAVMGMDVGTDTSINRFVLDKLAPSHPLFIQAYWGHVVYFNTAAMKAMGLSETEPDLKGGYFERVPGTKTINGRCYEEACNYVRRKRTTNAQLWSASLHDMSNEALHFGVTTIQNMCTSADPGTYITELKRTPVPVRFRLIQWATMKNDGSVNLPGLKINKQQKDLPLVTISGTKWLMDGTPIERGAYYTLDYKDMPGWKGQLNFSLTEARKILNELYNRNDQPMFHVVGDSAINLILNEMNRSAKEAAVWQKRRVRFEHGDALMPASFEKAKKLGVIVVQNPSHFTIAGVLHQRYQEPLQKHGEPMKSLLKAGIPVAIGSDGPMNPYLNIMFACMHPFNPSEALTVEEAVIAYTSTAAYAEGRDDKGTIAAGQLADLIVLSQDIFTIPLPQLPGTHSLLTIIDGKIVHRKM